MAIDVGVLLQKADCGEVITKLGIRFEKKKSKRGHELYFPCPTNNHTEDSMKLRCSVAEAGRYKGHFYCWACGFRGNLIHLIKFMTGCGFMDAVRFLESDYGSGTLAGIEALKFKLKMQKPDRPVKVEREFTLPDDYTPILESDMVEAKNAIAWLTTERHISYEAMERFQIGVCVHQKIGFCVVLPVIFEGKMRSVFYAQPFKGGLKRYPPDSPQGEILYNHDNCLIKKSCIMVESILDVVKIWSVTELDTAACFTNMISDNQLKLLSRFDVHGVMPDLDGHRGWDLVDRMVPTTGKGLMLYFVPLGKDPGDCTPDEIVHTLENGVKYSDYEFAQMHGGSAPRNNRVTRVLKK